MNEIECRGKNQGVEITDVSYPNRTVTVIVAPYEKPAVINGPHRSFTEIISRGAYNGVQRRVNKIRANRDHDWGRLAGKVIELYPDRDEGLVADVRMFKTTEGTETLELCAEDALSASAGFGLMREHGATGPVKPGAEVWENNRTLRRLKDLWLDHVAFVPNPAYETATVLDVRRGEPEAVLAVVTPNRDRLALEQLRAEMAAIDRRYNV